jgi:hypothetical protein
MLRIPRAILSRLGLALALALVSAEAPLRAQAYVAAGDQRLYRLDLGNGALTPIGFATVGSLGGVACLAARDGFGELWCGDQFDGEFGTLDPRLLQWQLRGALPVFPQEMVWDLPNARLLVFSTVPTPEEQFWYEWSPATGQFRLGGRARIGTRVDSIDIDSQGRIWAYDLSNGNIHQIQLAPFSAQRVATTRPDLVDFAIDRANDAFFAVDRVSRLLYRLDPHSGAVQAIGSTGRNDLLCFAIERGSCAGAGVPFGEGCLGAGGFPPRLSSSGCAGPASTIFLYLERCAPRSHAFFLFGLGRQQTLLGNGCPLELGILFADPILSSPVFGGTLPGQGSTDLGLYLPANVWLSSFLLQALVLDPAAPGGFAMSNGLELRFP